MSEFKTTILKVAVHSEESNPTYGNGNTYVSVDDETGGPFLVIENDSDEHGFNTLRIEYAEFLAVAEAAKMLMHQMYIEKAALES